MLILSRKFNESLIIDGHIMVKVVSLGDDVVKLGILCAMPKGTRKFVFSFDESHLTRFGGKAAHQPQVLPEEPWLRRSLAQPSSL